MIPLILLLLLVLIVFGVGFVLKWLWIIAVILLIVWLLGFVFRAGGSMGARKRWYRW
jgi:hypothetical protein